MMVTYFVVFHNLSQWEHVDVEQKKPQRVTSLRSISHSTLLSEVEFSTGSHTGIVSLDFCDEKEAER